ncbi:MAG: hypothetical protein BA874_06425 [Desulfuromonadales bacterium C00003068]|jgi:CheY-like chemotaxis protein/HPt (histidine-containing phosphotransfer) domain-containing protein|nr:MAG: hypothetical protein BA874_06425 [Desulfuromonadales bacterium C00003068]
MEKEMSACQQKQIAERRAQNSYALIVHYDPQQCEQLQQAVETLGITCLSSRSGQDALRAWQTIHQRGTKVNWLIVNHRISDGSGSEFTSLAQAKKLLLEHQTQLFFLAPQEESTSKLPLKQGVTVIEDNFPTAALTKVLKSRINYDNLTTPNDSSVTPTVLVVDDNDLGRQAVSVQLESAGLTVIEAVNGAEAIKQVSEQRIDLILMDIQMPVMDGLEATRHLKDPSQAVPCATPIIAMTAHAPEETSKTFKDAGFSAHMQKPIEIESLYTALKHWLPAWDNNSAVLTLANAPQSPLSFTLTEVNIDAGLRRVAGKHDVYKKLLTSFVTQFSQFEQQTIDSIAAGQINDVIRQTHTLKGSASTLGAETLYQLAEKLEKQLHSNNYPKTLHKVGQKITGLCQEISQLELANPATTQNHLDGSDRILKNILQQLIEPLTKLKAANIKQLQSQLYLYRWPETLCEPVDKLHQLLDSYQFRAALDHAQSLIGKLEI